MADNFDDMEHLHGKAAADEARAMHTVPGQAKMGNYLGMEKNYPNHMPYGPLEGVPAPGGKNYYSQRPNSKER